MASQLYAVARGACSPLLRHTYFAYGYKPFLFDALDTPSSVNPSPPHARTDRHLMSESKQTQNDERWPASRSARKSAAGPPPYIKKKREPKREPLYCAPFATKRHGLIRLYCCTVAVPPCAFLHPTFHSFADLVDEEQCTTLGVSS